jgi:chromosome segregation ATPase
MTIEKTYEETVENRLADLNAQIKELAAKADQARADAKTRYQEEVRKLEEQRDETEAKLHELESSGDKAFEDLKSGMDKALDSLTSAVESAKARFSDESES